MKKLLSYVIIGACLFFVSLEFFACSKKEVPAVPVGVIAPLSGEVSQYGKALQNGMLLALKEINSASQQSGEKQLDLKFEDSKGSATAGINAFRKLIDYHKTPIVLGAMFSKVTMAIAPLAEKEKVVLLSPTSSDVNLTKAGDYIFRIYPSDSYDGEYLAQYFVSRLSVKRAAVMYLTTSSTTAITEVFKDRITKAGGEVVLVEGHDQKTRDFRSVLKKLNEHKPDAVLLSSYLDAMALILRQSKELGYKFNFVAISTIYDEKIFELASNAAEGVVFSTAIFDSASKDPLIRKFVQTFNNQYKELPNIWAAYGYDCVRIASEAIRKSNGTATSIKEALYKIKDFPGVTGKTTFDENGDVTKSLRMMIIKNNRFVPLGS